MKMTWKQHREMLIKSWQLVMLGFLAIAMIVSFVFASAVFGQWRVDVNVARQDAVMQVIRLEESR